MGGGGGLLLVKHVKRISGYTCLKLAPVSLCEETKSFVLPFVCTVFP